MLEIEIGPPGLEDLEGIRELLATTVRDTFAREQIDIAYPEELRDEIKSVESTLDDFLQSIPGARAFFVACNAGRPVGTAAIASPNQIIREQFASDSPEIPEIKSVYVHPQFQKQGVGKALFQASLEYLRAHNLQYYYLTGGYSGSIVYWKEQLGSPNLVLEDHWGPGQHHCIWKCKILT